MRGCRRASATYTETMFKRVQLPAGITCSQCKLLIHDDTERETHQSEHQPGRPVGRAKCLARLVRKRLDAYVNGDNFAHAARGESQCDEQSGRTAWRTFRRRDKV